MDNEFLDLWDQNHDHKHSLNYVMILHVSVLGFLKSVKLSRRFALGVGGLGLA